MLKNKWFTLFLVVVLLAGVWSLASADDNDVKIVYGEKPFILSSGDSWEGDVLILGGSASVSRDAAVTGDVTLLGGALRVDGRIGGDLTALGGNVVLGETAEVEGDLTAVRGSIERSAQAMIRGDIVESTSSSIERPDGTSFTSYTGFSKAGSKLGGVLGFMLSAAMLVLQVLIITGAAILLTFLLENQITNTAAKITALPLQSLGVGFVAYALMIILILALFLTILGIPVSVILILLLAILSGYAEIIVGCWFGRMVCTKLNMNWPAVLVNAVGTLVVCGVTDAFAKCIPCIGWIPNVLVSFLGLGALCIRWFGLFGSTPAPRTSLPPRNDDLQMIVKK